MSLVFFVTNFFLTSYVVNIQNIGNIIVDIYNLLGKQAFKILQKVQARVYTILIFVCLRIKDFHHFQQIL